jgi:hypothetical protein
VMVDEVSLLFDLEEESNNNEESFSLWDMNTAILLCFFFGKRTNLWMETDCVDSKRDSKELLLQLRSHFMEMQRSLGDVVWAKIDFAWLCEHFSPST